MKRKLVNARSKLFASLPQEWKEARLFIVIGDHGPDSYAGEIVVRQDGSSMARPYGPNYDDLSHVFPDEDRAIAYVKQAASLQKPFGNISRKRGTNADGEMP